MPTTIRAIAPAELERCLPRLAELLCESVNGGASLGFLRPLTPDDTRTYWLSLHPELRAGRRLLLAAYVADDLVGSGQLTLPSWPNARHRAELQKLFVATRLRGRGVGRSIVVSLHDLARRHGRSLIILNTRRGDQTETFYHGLGYQTVGVTPGYTIGPAGERFDNLTLYHDL